MEGFPSGGYRQYLWALMRTSSAKERGGDVTDFRDDRGFRGVCFLERYSGEDLRDS
jgi:hypothetical protein